MLVPSTPMNDDRLTTSGSVRTASASACWRSDIALNEMSCGALVMPRMAPVSCIGKEALGDFDILQAGDGQREARDEQRYEPDGRAPSRDPGRIRRSATRSRVSASERYGSALVRTCGRRMSAHIIGVSVSETTAERTMAIASVMANSWNSRPTTSRMNSSGISTAISETVSEMMVKPISPAPFSAACKRLFALLDIARDVLDHHDGVVDDKAGRDRQRHQRKIVERKAEQIHAGQRADQRQRRREAGTTVARQVAQKEEDHQHDQPDRERELELDVGDGSADGRRLVGEDRAHRGPPAASAAAWAAAPSPRRRRRSRSVPGWRWTLRMMAGVRLAQAACSASSGPSTTVATSPRRTARRSCRRRPAGGSPRRSAVDRCR